MKRFHIHVSVENLDRSIQFYSTLFGATPARVEADYSIPLAAFLCTVRTHPFSTMARPSVRLSARRRNRRAAFPAAKAADIDAGARCCGP